MKKVLVLFANYCDRLFLDSEKFPGYCFFHEDSRSIFGSNSFHAVEFVEKIKKKYRNRQLDGILCTQDYPGLLIAAVLTRHFDLPGCSLESTLRLQHKYSFRQMEQKIIPEISPPYALVASDGNIGEILPYPFFIKPIKSVFSFLSQIIENKEQLRQFLKNNRRVLQDFSLPFQELTDEYTGKKWDANCFIAEQILEGEQVTVDGFCHGGKTTIIGIVDSIMYPGTKNFHSFEYPSRLPKTVQDRMIDLTCRLMSASEFDHAMFNLEMFYHRQKDRISIIEVNPRMFFAAADYYQKVDGINTYQTALELACGQQPQFIRQKGPFSLAATFTPRLFENKWVTRVPTPREIEEIQKDFPDLLLRIEVKEGEQLSSQIQSTGSYKYAIVNLGGQDREDLYRRFDMVMSRLNFEFT